MIPGLHMSDSGPYRIDHSRALMAENCGHRMPGVTGDHMPIAVTVPAARTPHFASPGRAHLVPA